MNKNYLSMLLTITCNYNEEEIKEINKAFLLASSLHKGQFRESGEEYIIHPLSVASILSNMHADKDTICAGLLHDTIEDTNFTKQDIEKVFNKDVAMLVDGVTKLKKLEFNNKKDQNLANTRKIITGIPEDIRIIIIKLADRLHNMETLNYKKEYKQKEISLETLELYVPLAYYIGAYDIKSKLEDLSFKYLKPNIYKLLEEKQTINEEEYSKVLNEMLYKITTLLNNKDIPNTIKIKTKNIYGIYKKLIAGKKLNEIHDLVVLKILVNEVDDCYRTLGIIHSEYHPVNNSFKDYISNPKTNMYRSIHTTVFGLDDKLVEAQIRTHDMDKIDTSGLTAYWDINRDKAASIMQSELKEKYQFFKYILELNDMFSDNQEFVSQVKDELLNENVYVFTTKGDVIELPKGSTPIDFAYKIHSEIGNKMSRVEVNDKEVPFNYILKNNDRVKIITNELDISKEEYLNVVKTSTAKRKIKELVKKI